MYENVIYEDILQRMLDKIPATMDKREGSIIYDALAPVAVEIQNMFIQLDVILNESFADTASLGYLIRRAAERGITQKEATNAVLRAVATPESIDIPIGSRFSLNELNYILTEKVADGVYTVQCETPGAVGNSYFGDLIPIDFIQGLESIKITELSVPGGDDEDVESLRRRYFETTTSQAYGGNIADYKKKILETPELGVGGVKIIPIWNGGGTVKVIVVDNAFKTPGDDHIEIIQNMIDPADHQGQGYGIAPIGHIVTVEGATSVPINITTQITYKDGWSFESAATSIKDAVDNYLTELCKTWDEDNETELIVRVSRLESAILDCEGVIDISGTLINNYESNLRLKKHQIPIRGTINGSL